MKIVYYNNDFFKILKHIDYKCDNELIGIVSDACIAEEDIARIQKNQWNKKNNFVYVINKINKIELANFLKTTPICCGVAINLNYWDDNIPLVYEHCKSLNYKIYINIGIDNEKLKEFNIVPTKFYGEVHDIT